MGKLILITGGARSGKSVFAESIAVKSGKKVLYVATALPTDVEMQARIDKHRQRRPQEWDTFEGYQDLKRIFHSGQGNYDLILLDCVTVMISNLIYDLTGAALDQMSAADLELIEKKISLEIKEFIDEAVARQVTLIMVTNEVGYGIVPNYPLARFFRDVAGRINQLIAFRANEVYLTVCGLPMKIK